MEYLWIYEMAAALLTMVIFLGVSAYRMRGQSWLDA